MSVYLCFFLTADTKRVLINNTKIKAQAQVSDVRQVLEHVEGKFVNIRFVMSKLTEHSHDQCSTQHANLTLPGRLL